MTWAWEAPLLGTATESRKFCMIWWPFLVMMLSGWNWTPCSEHSTLLQGAMQQRHSHAWTSCLPGHVASVGAALP